MHNVMRTLDLTFHKFALIAVYKLDGKSCVAIIDLVLPPVKFTALTSPFWEILFFLHMFFVPMCLLKLFFL